MSRARHLELELPGGLVRFNVSLNKSFGEKQGFKMTWKDPKSGKIRTVNTLRVVSKEEGMRPTEIADIHKVLGWTEPSTSFEYKDEHNEKKLLPIDKSILGALFKSDSKLRVQSFLPADQFSFADMAGDHYYLTPKVDRKAKTAATPDLQGYALLHWILKERKQVLEVKFVSGDREKIGVVYPRGECLMLSTVIHSNFQRPKPDNVGLEKLKEVELRNPERLADKLLGKYGTPERNPKVSEDVYEKKLKLYLEELKERERKKEAGEEEDKPKIAIKPVKPHNDGDDLFSMLENL